MDSAFFIFGGIAALGAAGAVMFPRLIHCALSLLLSFFGLAGLFLHLGSEFLAWVQLLVYVGAVGILIVFSILLTRAREGEDPGRYLVPGLIASGSVFLLLASAIFISGGMFHFQAVDLHAGRQNTGPLGEALFTHYLIPLEVAGILLTAALIGAVVISRNARAPGMPAEAAKAAAGTASVPAGTGGSAA